MKRIGLIISLIFALWSSALFAAINAMNGVTINTDSNIMGVAHASAVMGQTVVAAASGPSVVAQTVASSSGGGNVTTSGINTTGSNLIVVFVSWYPGSTSNITLTDSNGNTWTPLTFSSNSNTKARLFYCSSPSVGSGHTFTSSGASTYSCITVQAWSGMSTSSVFDVENGAASTSVSSLATGSITPSQANTVVIAGVSHDANSISSIDSSFTITGNGAYSGGNALAGAIAYKILTSATAQNPTWTFVGAGDSSARIASFKY